MGWRVSYLDFAILGWGEGCPDFAKTYEKYILPNTNLKASTLSDGFWAAPYLFINIYAN